MVMAQRFRELQEKSEKTFLTFGEKIEFGFFLMFALAVTGGIATGIIFAFIFYPLVTLLVCAGIIVCLAGIWFVGHVASGGK